MFTFLDDGQRAPDKIVAFIDWLGKAVLTEKLPADVRSGVETSIKRIGPAYDVLRNLLAPMEAVEPDRAKVIYEMVFSLMGCTAAVCASLNGTKKAREFHYASIKDGAAKGGNRSGETRKAKAKKWQAIARPMATEIQRNAPKRLSLDKLALEIDATWKHKDPPCPGQTTLKAFLKKMENAGEFTDNALKSKGNNRPTKGLRLVK